MFGRAVTAIDVSPTVRTTSSTAAAWRRLESSALNILRLAEMIM